MVVLGRLVGTFEPPRVMVTIAQANSASARANTSAPNPPAGTAAGTNGKGKSQLSASPASTATAHAIGGRIMTFAVSVESDLTRCSICCHCRIVTESIGPEESRDQPAANRRATRRRSRPDSASSMALQGAVAALSRPKTLAGASGSACEDEIDKWLKSVYD